MTHDETVRFYGTNYDIIGQWFLQPGSKVVLGDKKNRTCRFCGKRPPAVTFRKVAHAIPESLGNKSIESTYECDVCNEAFGKGIENDLGNWSKPTRTFARIRGKSGVPTIKRGGDTPGWRIEYGNTGFNITAYEDDPVFTIDEGKREVTFTLKRDPYTPVAVLKAFMKIGLTLLPDNEIDNFKHLMKWVCSPDHARVFAEKCPIIYSFQPGPMPNDLIVAFILRRKPHADGVPYAFLVLGYGNEVFQVMLPSELHDRITNGQALTLPPFAPTATTDQARYGNRRVGTLNMTGRDVIRGGVATIVVGYDYAIPQDAPDSPTAE